MTTKLRVAIEQSTYFPIVSFFDEDDGAEVVKTLIWTLTDTLGNIINNRNRVAILNPSSVETVKLSGDDLAILSGTDDGERLFTVEATYDSDLGTDMPLNGEASFTVINLTAIPTVP